MKAAVFYGKKDLRVEDIPMPTVGAGEVPVNGDSVILASTTQTRPNNDIQGLTLANFTFSGYGEKAIRAALVRGIAIYPWTFDASSFNNYFKWGYSGLTGNNADAFKRYIKTVTVTGAENGTAFNVGDTVDLTVTGTTYARKDSNDTANAVFTLVEFQP